MKLTQEQLKRIIREELKNLSKDQNLDEGWKEWMMGLGLLAGMAGSSPAQADDSPAPETAKQTMQVDQNLDASGIQVKVDKASGGGYDITVSKGGASAGGHVDGDLDDANMKVMQLKAELLQHLQSQKTPSKAKSTQTKSPSSGKQTSQSDW